MEMGSGRGEGRDQRMRAGGGLLGAKKEPGSGRGVAGNEDGSGDALRRQSRAAPEAPDLSQSPCLACPRTLLQHSPS